MSDTNTPAQANSMMPMFVVGGLLLVGFLMLSLLNSGAQDRQLNRSQIGVVALGPWLNDQGVNARLSHPRLRPKLDDLSLRVLPLFDLNLASDSPEPDDRAERIHNVTQRDFDLKIFQDKLDELPSVVLLPKWRGALLEIGIAHEQSLIPNGYYTRLFRQLDISGIKLLRGGPEFMTHKLEGGFDVALFHAQRFDMHSIPDRCQATVRFGNDALVIACSIPEVDHKVYFIADPDLMNNHGLRAAQNAGYAVALVKDLRGDTQLPVYIDNSTRLLTKTPDEDERQDYERGADEFSRFFVYPFSLFWAVLMIVLAVLFWRGSRRFGPVLHQSLAARETSKRAAISAKARLLRLTGNDGRMVSDFVRLQLQDLGARSFGGALGQGDAARFMALLARRDPELATEFSTVTDALITRGAEMMPQELDRHLSTYQSLLKKVVQHYEPV